MDALLERTDWLYALLVVMVAVIPAPRWRAFGGAGLCLALLALASGMVEGPPGDSFFVTTNEILILLGTILVFWAAWRGWREGPPVPVSAPRGSGFPDALLLVGLLLALVAPNLIVLALGMALAVTSGVRRVVAKRSGWWALPLGVGSLALGAGLTMMLTILGREGRAVAAVPEGPWSPAGERLLVLLLGSGGFLLSGLPPLHRAPWRLTLEPLAAIGMARLVLPAFSEGLIHWQVIAVGVLVLSAGWAAIRGQWEHLAIAAALAAFWSGSRDAVLAGGVLTLTGWLLDRGWEGELAPVRGLSARWIGLALLAPALLAPPALAGMLAEQVGLTVVLVLLTAAGCLTDFRRRSRAVFGRLY